MIKLGEILISLCFLAALSGCNIPDNTPLVFLQTTTVGISAGTTAAQGSPDISLGYRDVDLAIVPVIAGGKKVRGVGPTNPDGSIPVDAVAMASDASGKGKPAKLQDALSVFGQFQVDTSAAAAGTASVGLGKFFATGLAARSLATGYECKLGNLTSCK